MYAWSIPLLRMRGRNCYSASASLSTGFALMPVSRINKPRMNQGRVRVL